MPNLLRKIFERPYTFKENGYDRKTAPAGIRVGDAVEYAVTATDGITYSVVELHGESSEATIRSATGGKQYRVAAVMLRKIV